MTITDVARIDAAFHRTRRNADILQALAVHRHAAEIGEGERRNAAIHGRRWYALSRAPTSSGALASE